MLGWGMALGGQIIIARRVGEGTNDAVVVWLNILLFTLAFWPC
jgi:uncharacterized membrane protein YqaE (UPF0057 family)